MMFRHLLFAADGTGGGGTGAGEGGAGAGGGTQTSWIDTLPDEIKSSIGDEDRADPAVTKYKNLPELVKGYRNTVQLVGKKGVIIPDEKATPEEVDSFQNTVFKAIGRPDKADGYKLSDIKDLHPSLKPTPESQKEFFDAAHKLGFSNKQADQLNSWYLGKLSKAIGDQEKAFEESKTKAVNDLRNEWGKDFDSNLGLAKTFVEKIGGTQALDAFGDLGNNPAVLKVLAVAGKAFSEDGFGKFGQQPGGGDAQSAIDAVLADGGRNGKREHPYWNEKHPDHSKWVGPQGELQKLYQKAEQDKK